MGPLTSCGCNAVRWCKQGGRPRARAAGTAGQKFMRVRVRVSGAVVSERELNGCSTCMFRISMV
jgi:hypothetical protein